MTVFEVVEWCVLLTHFITRSSVELLVVEGCAGAEESCTFMGTVILLLFGRIHLVILLRLVIHCKNSVN